MDKLKQRVALQAAKYCQNRFIECLGVGTGSTVNYFIAAIAPLAPLKVVASSQNSATLLQQYGFQPINCNEADQISLYIDGADLITPNKQLLKGLGGALTREKILATRAQEFICIADDSKLRLLNRVTIPIEVLDWARSSVAHQLIKLGATPIMRANFTSDNGNPIIDATNFPVSNYQELEVVLNNIPGVVENGIFAAATPTQILVASERPYAFPQWHELSFV